jgi:hypothetical protein
MKITENILKSLKKLSREVTKNKPLGTKVLEDKRTKRNRTRSDQKRKAIKEATSD